MTRTEETQKLTRRPIRDLKKEFPANDGIDEDLENQENHRIEENDKRRAKGIYPDLSSLNEFKNNFDVPVDEGVTPEVTSKPQDTYHKTAVWSLKFVILMSVIFLFVIIFAYYNRFFMSVSLKIHSSDKNNIEALMTDLKKEFGSQPKSTFKIVQAALKSFFNSTSPNPVVIMLLVAKNAKDEGIKFGDKIASHITPSSIYTKIDGKDLKHKNPDDAKQFIDIHLKREFSESLPLNVLLIENLQDVPFEAVMIFHNYCDHENASFKNAIYLMIVYSDKDIPSESEPKDWEKLVKKTLENAWSNFHIDQRSSTISRITGRVVAVFPKL